ncbi:MAG: peptidylprolyl isomerase [Magnetococcales bacterium]|nr:peptidylprolyl isomerase [Magnetococcales bacterium]
MRAASNPLASPVALLTVTNGSGNRIPPSGQGNATASVSNLTLTDLGDAFSLAITGADVRFALANLVSVAKPITRIDLSSSDNNTLVVTATDILNRSPNTRLLTVDGGAGDVVNMGPGWLDGGVSGAYHLYTQRHATLQVANGIRTVTVGDHPTTADGAWWADHPDATKAEYISQLLRFFGTASWGTQGSALVLKYRFMDSSDVAARAHDQDELNGFIPLTAAQQQAAVAAMQLWQEVCGVTFVPAAAGESPNLFFGASSATHGGGTYTSYWSVNDRVSDAYIWLSSQWDSNGETAVGQFGFKTLLHEIGHALGLGHPGTYNAQADWSGRLYGNDDVMHSILSYFSTPPYESLDISPSTPMMMDIAALQQMYGANQTTRSGDDTYSVQSDSLRTIWDAGGTDLLDASLLNDYCSLDLRPGSFSSIGQGVNNWAIAWGVTIENANGGSLEDRIIGNDSRNVLRGNGGNDTLVGGRGDQLLGGDGDDLLSVDDLAFTLADGGSGSDTLAWSGAGQRLTLAELTGSLRGIENIDLTGSGDNGLILTAADLRALALSNNTLTVEGNSGDRVAMGSGWVDAGSSADYHLYRQDGLSLRVAAAVTGEVTLSLPSIPSPTVTEPPLVPPTLTVSALRLTTDSGSSASDFVTNTATQTLTGQLSAALGVGESLYGSLDGGTTWSDISRQLQGNRLTWSGVTLSGSSSIQIKASNAAGAGPVTQQAYTLDSTAPVAPQPAATAFPPQVTLTTNLGTIALAMEPLAAPNTVANMLRYVDAGFYSNTLFHRVIPGFMAQGGGFTTGLAYRTPTHDPITLESTQSSGLANRRGTVAMARTSDPNSATSQFFINLVDNGFLDYASTASPGYAVFGHVFSGLSVVDSMATIPTTTVGPYQNVPRADILIKNASALGVSNSGLVILNALESGGRWEYSQNGGQTWLPGSTDRFTLPAGSYAAGTVQIRQWDAAGNASPLFRSDRIWRVDKTPPTVISAAVGTSTTQAPGSTLVLTFSEPIRAGTGTLQLTDAEGRAVDSLEVATSNRLSFAGNTLTLAPSTPLALNGRYTLSWAGEAIRDWAGTAQGSTSRYTATFAIQSSVTALNRTQVAALTTTQMAGLTATQIRAFSTTQVGALTPTQITALTTTQIAALKAQDLPLLTAGLSPAQLTALSTTQIRGLSSTQVQRLSSTQVAGLGSSQMAALATSQLRALSQTQLTLLVSSQVAGLTTAQWQGLTTTQVAALRLEGVSKTTLSTLGSLQLRALTPEQLGSLSSSQWNALTPAQIPLLTPTQLGALSGTQVAALTTAQVKGLTGTQLAALNRTQMRSLELTDIAQLSTAQLRGFRVEQLGAWSATQWAGLPPVLIGNLSTTQLAGLEATALAALTTSQGEALGSKQLASLSVTQLSGLTATVLAGLSSSQLAGLTGRQIATLESTQVRSLTTRQIAALSFTQVAALTTAQFMALEPAQVGSVSATLGALSTTVVRQLSSGQLRGLSTQQIQNLSTTQVGALTASQITALTTTQVKSLEVRDMPMLAAVAGLTTTQISVLSAPQMAALSSSQVQQLSTGQIGGLSITQIRALTTAQIPGLQGEDIAALGSSQIAALSGAQIKALTSEAVAGLALAVPRLSPAQQAALEPEDFARIGTDLWSSAQVRLFTPAQKNAYWQAGGQIGVTPP